MLNFKYVPPAKVKMKIQNSIPHVRDKQQINLKSQFQKIQNSKPDFEF